MPNLSGDGRGEVHQRDRKVHPVNRSRTATWVQADGRHRRPQPGPDRLRLRRLHRRATLRSKPTPVGVLGASPDRLHQRQVLRQPDQRGHLPRRRHPAAHRQPGLPRSRRRSRASAWPSPTSTPRAASTAPRPATTSRTPVTRPTCRSPPPRPARSSPASRRVVIGAASSSVSLNVVDTFADNKIVEVSPANTAVDLSGYSPYYFRTAPPDGVQGNALGTLITHRRLPEGRLPGVQRHLRHRPAQRGRGDRQGRRRRVRLRLQGRRRRVPGRPDDVLVRGRRRARGQARRDRRPRLRRDQADRPRARRRRAGTCRRPTSPTATPPTTARTSRRAPSRAPRAPSPAPTPTQTFKDRLSGWAEVGEGKAAAATTPTAPSPTTPPSSPRSPR